MILGPKVLKTAYIIVIFVSMLDDDNCVKSIISYMKIYFLFYS